MSTAKTTFHLTNGTQLTDVLPLESNGPSTGGLPNQSIPITVQDIVYEGDNTVIVVAGDFSDRLKPLKINSSTDPNSPQGIVGSIIQLPLPPADPNEHFEDLLQDLLAAGLAVGMYVDISDRVLPVRTTITEIRFDDRKIVMSAPSPAPSNGSVTFSYPFSIIDVDPSTPSPYIGNYGAYASTFDGKVTRVTLSPSTPLQSEVYDICGVSYGTSGRWTVQGYGLRHADRIFYIGATVTVLNNPAPAVNGQYTVTAVTASSTYQITGTFDDGNGGTLIHIAGNVAPFFISGSQLTLDSSITSGIFEVDGEPVYNNGTDITAVRIVDTITADPDAIGTVTPRIPTALVTVAEIIPMTVGQGSMIVKPLQMDIEGITVANDGASPTSFIINWRVPADQIPGDPLTTFAIGREITVKHTKTNSPADARFRNRRLTISGTTLTMIGGEPFLIISTPVIDKTEDITLAVFANEGNVQYSLYTIIFPPPAVPYGHVRYTVLTPATSLQLIGRGVTHYNDATTWGQALQNNSIHMLENFANDEPPPSPIEGQLWFDTATPGLNVRYNNNWSSVITSGMPSSGSIDMNGNTIFGLADINQDTPDLTQAINVGSADARYVNVTGDGMTGQLDMNGNMIVGLPPTASADPTQAVSVELGDARYINVTGDEMAGILDMGQHRITRVSNPQESQDAATKSYVDSLSSGIIWLQPILDSSLFDDTLASPPVVSDPDLLVYRSYYVKPTAYAISGVNDATNVWAVGGDRTLTILAGHTFIVKDNLDTASNGTYTVVSTTFDGTDTRITVSEDIPPTAVIGGTLYHAGGAWNSFAGRIIAWTGTQWVDVLDRVPEPGDRFGVFFELDNDENTSTLPGGSFGVGGTLGTSTISAAGKIVTVESIANDYTVTWGPVHTPAEPDAVSVLGKNSPHYGHSYTFRGTWGNGSYGTSFRWIEFAGPSVLVDGAGLKYSGNVLNVGAGTGITVTANAVNVNTTYMNTNYMRRDGSTAFTGNISLGSNRLVNVNNPVNPQDAVTLSYLTSNYVSSSGSAPMTGNLNLAGFAINNVADPVAPQDAATMAYADTKVAKAGDTMTGTLSMSSATGDAAIDMGIFNKIINLADPSSNRDAVNLQTADGRYVRKAGDVMSGYLTLHDHPVQTHHSATKFYVDNAITNVASVITTSTIDGGAF